MNLFDAIAKAGISVKESSAVSAFVGMRRTKSGKLTKQFARIAASPDSHVPGLDVESLTEYVNAETTVLPTVRRKLDKGGDARAVNASELDKEGLVAVLPFLVDSHESETAETSERETAIKEALAGS